MSLNLDEIRGKPQAREATFDRASANTEARTVELAFSSEAPYERWWGIEVLSHDRAAVNLERIGNGANVLVNHNADDYVGVIESARVDDDKRGRATVRFGRSARAEEVWRDVQDGILRSVSVGYTIDDMTLTRAGKNVAPDEYTVTRWTPYEISLVTIPADASVGVGRSAPTAAPAAATSLEDTMTTKDNAAAGAGADSVTPEIKSIDGVAIEQRRKESILKLCKANHIDTRVEEHWIKTGASLDQVSDELLVILEERGKAASTPAMLGMEKKDVRRYSVLKALRAVLSKDWSRAGLELEAHKAIMGRGALNPRSENSFFVPMDIQVRDMTAAGVSGSNYLVATDNLAGSFVELLRNESVVMGLGATRLTGLQGNVTIPRQTAAGTAYWLASDGVTQITESQPTLGQITLSPKNVAALTEISHQLMQQSDPSAEQLVMTDLARVLALAADVAALRGSGGSGQPTGITQTSGIGTFDTDSTDTYGDILDPQQDVAAANALRPGCAYVADTASAVLLMKRQRFSSTDTPLWDGSLLRGTMAGFPCMATNQMSANTMLFGWWPSLILAEWGVLELMVNPFSDFTRGLSSIRAWYTMDVALRYPAAFSYDSSVA
jgi:HK97 family phage major capsid protein/HK97 family phage prohead protease